MNKRLINNRNSIIDKIKSFSLPGGAQINDLTGLVIDKAKNAHIWDINRKKYLDFFTGVGVSNIGHSHPKFLELLSQQMSKCSVGTFNTEIKARLYAA